MRNFDQNASTFGMGGIAVETPVWACLCDQSWKTVQEEFLEISYRVDGPMSIVKSRSADRYMGKYSERVIIV